MGIRPNWQLEKGKAMRDKLNYRDGQSWKCKKGNWYNWHVSKSNRCWKSQRKDRHQYKPVQMF